MTNQIEKTFFLIISNEFLEIYWMSIFVFALIKSYALLGVYDAA